MHSVDKRGLQLLQEHHRWVLLRGTFLSELRTSTQFLKKFLLSESCANFLEWLAELAEISWKIPNSIRISRAYSHLPCLLVNPIPIRRHPSAREVQAFIERVHGLNQCPRYGGTFFCVCGPVRFFGRIFFSENLARTFSSGSKNLEKFPRSLNSI